MEQQQTRPKPTNKKKTIDGKPFGRPTVMTDDVLNKLRSAFSYGCTDEEACVVAGISHQTLYSFIQNNPDFLEERNNLKLQPIIAARQMIVKNISKDLNHARWYATKKLGKEFGDKLNIEHEVVHKVKINLADPQVREALSKLDSFARASLLKPNETIETSQKPMEPQQD